MTTIKIGQLEISLDHREVRLDGRKVPIGSRAFDILALLIAADGGVVSQDEIMRGVWPTTIVEKNNLQVHVSALRRAFGEERDRISTVPGRGYRLLMDDDPLEEPHGPREREAASDDEAAAPEAARPARLPLPARVPELIGRQDALDGIAAALHAHQTVTLVGTGGIGKTRLAVEFAHAKQQAFADGVVFVSLAAVYDAQSALDALAFAMGSRLSASRAALTQIAAEWRDREALVVLDNCEQVLEIVAAVAEALTGAGSRMRVLATSREALRVRDEIVYQVPPLDVPTPGDPGVDVLSTPAVRFFLARAQADGAQFSLDDDSIRLTGEVCRRLDGIPLALELAASRAAVLGIGLLAAHLDDRFRILTGGRRTALPRHQTLKATLDWSYRLLSRDEQKLLRWLGMFVNGFTLDMACAMAERAGLTRMEALDAVSGLVSRSLLTTDLEGSSYRYRLLETTRAYAQQQLDDNGERASAASAHAALFLSLLEAAQKQWAEQPVVEWLGDFTREVGNVRTALDWTLGGRGDAAVGIDLAALTVPYLFDLSLVEECCERARAALQRVPNDEHGAPEIDVETRLRLVSALASALVYTEGPLKETRDAWTLVLNEAVRAGHADYASRARWGVWNWHQYSGRARDALMLARRFGDLARSTGNATHVVLAGRVEGIALHYAGDQARAKVKSPWTAGTRRAFASITASSRGRHSRACYGCKASAAKRMTSRRAASIPPCSTTMKSPHAMCSSRPSSRSRCSMGIMRLRGTASTCCTNSPRASASRSGARAAHATTRGSRASGQARGRRGGLRHRLPRCAQRAFSRSFRRCSGNWRTRCRASRVTAKRSTSSTKRYGTPTTTASAGTTRSYAGSRATCCASSAVTMRGNAGWPRRSTGSAVTRSRSPERAPRAIQLARRFMPCLFSPGLNND
jgi:predicted ATPase/DNA-binding winged helix-turn-helix (wHTH) protein